MNKEAASVRALEIGDEIALLIEEARALVEKHCPMSLRNLDAYVFEQIGEHLDKSNRYNSDFKDVARMIAEGEESEDEDEDEDEDNRLICPVCNHIITDMEEGISDPCEHVMLTYVDICGGEFVHVGKGHEELAGLLTGRYEHLYESDDVDDKSLDELMHEYADEHDGFEVIELTTHGMSCGPCSSTEYHLIKKG